MQRHPSRHIARAFTLIELLTVIAIIAVLAAILFPIFGTAREQTRQTSTMSKMHAIYLGARLFDEDEGRFPPALFGYAETALPPPYNPTGPYARPVLALTDPVTPMDKATGSYTTNTNLIRGYLYGEQVKDYVTFLNDDNIGHTNTQITTVYYPLNSPHPPGATLTATLSNGSSVKLTLVTWRANNSTDTCPLQADIDFPCNVNEAVPCVAYDTVPKYYYINDSMDIGPLLDPTSGKQLMDTTKTPPAGIYELHYTPDWSKVLYDPVNNCDETNGAPNTTQLKYMNPPTERTIISWSTQHVATAGSPNTIILLDSGTARKIDYQDGIKQLPLNYNK